MNKLKVMNLLTEWVIVTVNTNNNQKISEKYFAQFLIMLPKASDTPDFLLIKSESV